MARMGFKAYNLARMARLGLPVPQAFVLGTPLCAEHRCAPQEFAERLRGLLKVQMARLQPACGLEFAAERKPLLVSVRSGAPVSMPGMMDTLLNIGLTDATLRGLLRLTGNPRLVWDSYRRLIQQFAEVVHAANPAPFRVALETAMQRARVARAQDLDFRSLSALAKEYLGLFESVTGKAFPQNPFDQLEAAIGAVFDSWRSARAVEYRRMHDIPEDMGTAVTVNAWCSATRAADQGPAWVSRAIPPAAKTVCISISASTAKARTWSLAGTAPMTRLVWELLCRRWPRNCSPCAGSSKASSATRRNSSSP